MTKFTETMPTVATVNYDQIYNFSAGTSIKYFGENRPVNTPHRKTLEKSILEQENECFYPIMVDICDLTIVDGHHRYDALQDLWSKGYTDIPMRVMFVNPSSKGIDKRILVHRMNNDVRKWTVMDYVFSYIKAGNENYKSLMKYMEECPITQKVTVKNGVEYKPRYASAMLKGKHCQEVIKSGNLTLSYTEYQEGLKVKREIEQIFDKAKYRPNQNLEGFIISWFEFRNKDLQIPFEEFLKGVQKNYGSDGIALNGKDSWFRYFCSVQTKLNRKKVA